MSTFVFCQALVLLQPGEQLYFIGRTGEPLVSEDEPGELFDYLRLAPLVLGVWLWQGRVAHGDEETRIEVGSSFRQLTEDESIAWTRSNRMPWDPRPLTWDEKQAGRAALAELVAKRQASNAREYTDIDALESASWRDSAAMDIDNEQAADIEAK